MSSALTPLQREVLEVFFRREHEFFLTGGAALAGFHLGHRETHDLDLFTLRDEIDAAERLLDEVARELGCVVERLHTSPDFRRRELRRSDGSVVVDLVRERVAQGFEKLTFGRVRVDPPGEILANKLCALLSRSEIRDLVDVMFLERAGHDIAAAFELARRKDGGLTPAQLAWVLSEIRIGDDARIPAGVKPVELRTYLVELSRRLSRVGFPTA